MLNAAQNSFLIVLWIVLSLTFLILLNRSWEPSRRRVHNDVIGWQISVIGVIYAVMIGFMLGSVWGNYQTAEANVDNEANALINLFRTADGLPAAQRKAVQTAASNYATAVLTQEWPAMSRSQVPRAGKPYIKVLWTTLTRTPTQNYLQQVSLQQSMQELSNLTVHRRMRILESMTGMPNMLWTVLVIGGMITTAACCLIGTENVSLHYSLIFALSLLISMALIAIADIDRSFQGSVHVSSYAFTRAQNSMMDPGPAPK